jgi:hypothetical protein
LKKERGTEWEAAFIAVWGPMYESSSADVNHSIVYGDVISNVPELPSANGIKNPKHLKIGTLEAHCDFGKVGRIVFGTRKLCEVTCSLLIAQ